MTAGVPTDDGGWADAPTSPTVPLAWPPGEGGPGPAAPGAHTLGEHAPGPYGAAPSPYGAAPGPYGAGPYAPGQPTPTQPLPVVRYAPTAPSMPPARVPRAWPAMPLRPRLPRWLRRMLIVVLGVALAAVLGFATMLLVTPSVSSAPALAQAFDRAHGAPYPGPQVPSRFAAALTSTEDHRFYSEPGFDPIAIGRVIIGRVTGQPDQGGATLYQQLAKMLYTRRGAGAGAEAEQFILGIKLDLSYSKPQILRMYADVTYFGHGYYGLAEASCGYFGVAPGGLSWGQAALLAGLAQAPTADNPIAHYSVARAREAHVLGRLVATGALAPAQAARAYRVPLHLVGGPAHGCTTHG